jgi:VIT1/CCC1 family predicted Fe2+/Mn2+ transporter
LQAAAASAVSFASGAILPILAAVWSPREQMAVVTVSVSLLALAVLGALSAQLGGASVPRSVGRIVFWGALAMALSAAVGHVFNIAA